jgi:hypothetical protein
MRKLFTFLGLTTVACLLAWGWLRQPNDWDILRQSGEKPTANLPVAMLIGEQSGYLLTPPEFVAQPFIRRIEWSPDGNYAVLFQTALRAETPTLDDAVMRHRVLLWNRKTRRLSVLWESTQTNREVNPNRKFQVAFVGKAPLCLFAVRVWDEAKQDDPWKAYVATIGGQVKLLGEYREAWLLAPPAEDIGYILVAESENLLYKRMYAPVGANGILANFQPVPEDLDITTLYAYSARRGNPDLWYEDGKQMLLSSFGPPIAVPEADGVQYRVEPVYSLWNLRTNQVQPIDNAPGALLSREPRNAASRSFGATFPPARGQPRRDQHDLAARERARRAGGVRFRAGRGRAAGRRDSVCGARRGVLPRDTAHERGRHSRDAGARRPRAVPEKRETDCDRTADVCARL